MAHIYEGNVLRDFERFQKELDGPIPSVSRPTFAYTKGAAIGLAAFLVATTLAMPADGEHVPECWTQRDQVSSDAWRDRVHCKPAAGLYSQEGKIRSKELKKGFDEILGTVDDKLDFTLNETYRKLPTREYLQRDYIASEHATKEYPTFRIDSRENLSALIELMEIGGLIKFYFRNEDHGVESIDNIRPANYTEEPQKVQAEDVAPNPAMRESERVMYEWKILEEKLHRDAERRAKDISDPLELPSIMPEPRKTPYGTMEPIVLGAIALALSRRKNVNRNR